MRIRLLTVFALVTAFSALPALAQERLGDGLYSSRTDLVKTTLTVGDTNLDIYAHPGVAVDRLVAGVDRAKSLGAQDLYKRIDANRREHFANEPLYVVGSPAMPEKAKLVKYFYLWNDQSFSGEKWQVACPTNGATAAVLFVASFYGEEDFYVKASSTAQFKFLDTVTDGDFFTYSQTAAKKTTLIYAWDTIQDSSGHIIAYCYN